MTIDKDILKEKQKEANRICHEAKIQFYNSKIEKTEENSKELFNLANSLLHKEQSDSLPSHSCEKELANHFGQYFQDKIENIRQEFPTESEYPLDMVNSSSSSLISFSSISPADLSKFITDGNSKSCSLDPMPTSLIKETLPILLPVLHSIVNKSLLEHTMPSSLKQAIVKPLIKKSSLDKENLKNFRPVSNLPYIGKIIEKAAITQIERHLNMHSLHEPLQSAYTANHSVETALLKVSSDILLSLDRRQCVYLVLLDLSAAFDTIDHNAFLKRLSTDYAVSGSVADWMRSYLVSRQQKIAINSTLSDTITLDYGFPQGSCIGPFGFKLYTKPLTSIAKRHNVSIHLYADDTQLYVPFNPSDSEAAMARLEECIEDIRQWMTMNFLKLNDSKTEFVILGSPQDVAKVTEWTVTVGGNEILPSTSARNIGAYFDSSLDMKQHVNNIIKSCYHQIRSLSKIRKYLTIDSSKKLVHAFVSSRLDNLNSLLIELPDTQLKRLQTIQNHAARLILQQKKSCHITPLLMELHWLPIKCRIEYKLLLLIYKCLHDKAPSYLSALLQPYAPSRALRSTSQHLLVEPPTKKKYGKRAFAVAGPHLWNALPLHIRKSATVTIFKTSLKTFLFRAGYNID